MSAADLRESVAWAPELLVAMAKAHDQEASAQKGEPSPWDVSIFGEPDQSFVAERVVAMQCALRAIADAGPTDAMVEAGAVAWYRSHGMPFDVLGDNTKATARKAIRSALSAALKEMGAG